VMKETSNLDSFYGDFIKQLPSLYSVSLRTKTSDIRGLISVAILHHDGKVVDEVEFSSDSSLYYLLQAWVSYAMDCDKGSGILDTSVFEGA